MNGLVAHPCLVRPGSGYLHPMDPQGSRAELREALKSVAVALKESELPFALVGGYAIWARGGPEPDHDVDLMVAQQDAAEAAAFLADRGFQVVQPPEDWLFKVFIDGAMVDVIFRAGGVVADRKLLERAEILEVLSVTMPVLPATELMVQKLSALNEHLCDFGAVLPPARALREQVDWAAVEQATAENDFAAALLFLLRRLDVIEPAE
jgi:Aminoglycoside-2''-adenylyltransferase